MTSPARIALFACSVFAVACEGGSTLGPAPLFTLQIAPTQSNLLAIAPANTIRVTTQALGDDGSPLTHSGIVTYSSGNPSVAMVSSNGMVTASAPGEAQITATLTLGSVTRNATMTVVVYPPITGAYEITARPTIFDAAWGDLTGARETFVLRILAYDGQFHGTFENLKFIYPDGEVVSGTPSSGLITGTIESTGRIRISAVNSTRVWFWSGIDKLYSPSSSGTWGCCGHVSGTFTADIRE